MSKTIMTLHDEQAGMVMQTANQQVAARSSGLVLGGGGGDWLGFVGRADLEEPARNAPSPATFLLPPAPLDDRAAQPEPKPKPGQLAGGDSSCKRFFPLPLDCVVAFRVKGNSSFGF